MIKYNASTTCPLTTPWEHLESCGFFNRLQWRHLLRHKSVMFQWPALLSVACILQLFSVCQPSRSHFEDSRIINAHVLWEWRSIRRCNKIIKRKTKQNSGIMLKSNQFISLGTKQYYCSVQLLSQ